MLAGGCVAWSLLSLQAAKIEGLGSGDFSGLGLRGLGLRGLGFRFQGFRVQCSRFIRFGVNTLGVRI